MGDRYFVTVICPVCAYREEDVWYAPTSGFLFWTCQCGERFDLEDLTGISAEGSANTEYGIEEIHRLRQKAHVHRHSRHPR